MNRINRIIIKIGKKIDKALYVYVLGLILIGIALGYFWAWTALIN